MKTIRSLVSLFLVSLCVLLQACSTSVKAGASYNPAPAESFNKFGKFELRATRFIQNYSADQAGLVKIEANLKKDLTPHIDKWNQAGENGRTLIIEPVIEQLEFKHGATRILFGPFAGSSGVLLRLNISDANGNLVASPEFFQRADAMAAGWVFGVHDNLMLTRVANLASNYVIANYSSAVGGPTGADDKATNKKN